MRLERLGPFERSPRLAVAVSGGADSLALALLAGRWARGRGGYTVGLTVDHRLRAQSTAEAEQVGAWLAARGIAHEILIWQGPYPESDRQAAARGARYRLLEAWCAQNGFFHLLLAHHLEDQAETFWLRLARGSGLEGLAAMSAIRERPACRLLRPLLDLPPERLGAQLRAAGQAWIEDPSNRNTSYARVRWRAARAVLTEEGLGADRLGETIRHLGRAREALEADQVRLLASAVRIDPAGFAWLEPSFFAATPDDIGLRALAALLTTIAGGSYPPRLERLQRLYRDLIAGALGGGRTLGGCRILVGREGILVCREPAAMAPRVLVAPGSSLLWDGRFRISLAPEAPPGLSVGGLGERRPGPVQGAERQLERLPGPARASLPALSDPAGLAAIPALGWVRADLALAPGAIAAAFRPSRPMAPVGFTVV